MQGEEMGPVRGRLHQFLLPGHLVFIGEMLDLLAEEIDGWFFARNPFSRSALHFRPAFFGNAAGICFLTYCSMNSTRIGVISLP